MELLTECRASVNNDEYYHCYNPYRQLLAWGVGEGDQLLGVLLLLVPLIAQTLLLHDVQER